MSRPEITDTVIDGLAFARACVIDQRVASHQQDNHTWDKRYVAALDAIDTITKAHQKSKKTRSRRAR